MNRRTLLIPEENMKSKKRKVNKTEEQKMNDPDYVFNPNTKRYVRKNGAIAKQVLDTYTIEELDVLGRRAYNEKLSAKQEGAKKPPTDVPKKKYKISRVGRDCDSSDWDSRDGRDEEKEASKFRRININLLGEGEVIPDKDSIEVNLIQKDFEDIKGSVKDVKEESCYYDGRRYSNFRGVNKSRKNEIEKIKKDVRELERMIPRERRIINYGNKKKVRKIDKAITRNTKSSNLNTMYVYTDGAVSNNLRRGSPLAVGGIGVYFGKNDDRNISERFQEKPVTNQRAEIWAIVRALEVILNKNGDDIDNIRIIIFTDSMYGMNVIMRTWKAKENIDLLKKAWALVAKIPKLEIKHIRAHTNKKDVHSIGNDMADRLAVAGRSK